MKKIIISLITLTAASAMVNAEEYVITLDTTSGASGTATWDTLGDQAAFWQSQLGSANFTSEGIVLIPDGFGFSAALGYLFFVFDVSDYTDITNLEFSFSYGEREENNGSLAINLIQPDAAAGPTSNEAVVKTSSLANVEATGSLSLSTSSAEEITSLVSAGSSALGANKVVAMISTFLPAGIKFSDIRLTVTASSHSPIPEPSMFGLLAGLGALALVGMRRRRRK